jgi:hypothetical protein
MVADCDYTAARSWHVSRHAKKKHPESNEASTRKSLKASTVSFIQKKSRKPRKPPAAKREPVESSKSQVFTLERLASDVESDAQPGQGQQAITFPTVAAGAMAMVTLPWELPMVSQMGER